jgi:hypothetical protein
MARVQPTVAGSRPEAAEPAMTQASGGWLAFMADCGHRPRLFSWQPKDLPMTSRRLLSLAISAGLFATASTAIANTGARTADDPSGETPANQVFLPNAVITEGFETFVGTAPNQCIAGWTCTNLSSPLGTTNWSQGILKVFPAQAGSPASYISANFNNTSGAGTINNWLITPQVSFGNGATLSFWSRTTTGATYPDRLEIRLSTAGASTNTTDFNVVLGTINPALVPGGGPCVTTASGTGGYPNTWCQYTLSHAQGIPTSGSGRIAFRYFVANGGPSGSNSDYIGIDTFSFDEGVLASPPVFSYTPTPGSTVTATGGTGLVGSTSNLTITPAISTPGTGTGAPATTTLTCTAPTAPFAGFAQTVTAVGTGAISGGPLAGTCTRGTAAATATLTCSENQGGTAVARTWTLSCPAGTIPSVPVNATSTWSLIALMLALFGFAAATVRRQG